MKTVILTPNPYRDKGFQTVRAAMKVLRDAGVECKVCLPFEVDRSFELPRDLRITRLDKELPHAEMVVCFGGDGTILHMAKTATRHNIPVLGVNIGTMGFMAELESSELDQLARLAKDDYTLDSRMMLDVTIHRDRDIVFHDICLNDAVITKGAVARTIRLFVDVGSCRLGNFAGDGVIIATPTGSTGYSLSAGGPIVEPTAQNFVVSPICAHSLSARAYVLSAENEVTVKPQEAGHKPMYLAVDGGKAFSIRDGDTVRIRRSRYATELIRLTDKSIYDILRTKLSGDISHEK